MNLTKATLLVTLMTLPHILAQGTPKQTPIFNKLFHWFQYNHVKVNPEKCSLLLSFKTPTDVSIGDASFKTSTKETLLEILIDSVLTNMFLPFVVKLARNCMLWDALLPLCLLKK